MTKLAAKLAIGMPVFNGENFMHEALDSLLGQSFGEFELIISDNASTDATADIAADYAARDRRVRYVRLDSNIGAARNYDNVYRLASAPYFKWAAHDDYYSDNYLEECVGVLDADPGVVLCQATTRLVDDQGQEIAYDPLLDMYLDRDGRLVLASDRPDRARSDRVFKRFRDIYLNVVRCYDIFGVMRRDALDRTSLHRPYYGSDRALLIEMALLGKYHEATDAVFFNRKHAAQSMALPNLNDQNKWINPGGKGQRRFPLTRQILAAVLRTPMPLADRARCLALILSTSPWQRLFRLSVLSPRFGT